MKRSTTPVMAGSMPSFQNYRPFYDAIKAKHSEVITIADCPIPQRFGRDHRRAVLCRPQ
jgi:predicted RNase H-like nuclease